jgi:hypothetical protein
VDNDRSGPDTTGREILGVLAILLGVLGALVTFVLTLGWVASAALGAAAIVTLVGYRLATSETGSGSGSGSGIGGTDGLPAGLYVDPEEPDSFIPR